MNKWHRECLSVASELGVQGAALESGGKHAKIAGVVDGRSFSYPVSHGASTSRRQGRKMRCGIARRIRELRDGGAR